MPKNLLIVESTKKAKTIKGLLGASYTIRATGGHILEMPGDDIHVNLETFTPVLYLIRGKGKTLAGLKTAANKADQIYLATDPDREGEAIAHHVVSRLGREAMTRAQRVAFTAITEGDVKAALAQPRAIDHKLVEAQTARRVIDRLVGYMVSPVLWAGLSGMKRLSAGRVQSPALWLSVDRERAIQRFVPEEWWSVDAELSKQDAPQKFWAKLYRVRDQKPSLKIAEDAQAVKQALEGANWRVAMVKKGTWTRRPYPPFTTDSLQQAASAQLGLSPNLTMKIAQQLYEGADVGEGKSVGLITYMRTDCVAVAPEAQQSAREVVTRYFGADSLPPKPPIYATRDKTAQEAHEAIRPTDPHRTPKQLAGLLPADQHKLYRLIWRRFVASQMKPAEYDTLTVDIETLIEQAVSPYLFRATGSTLRFAGFLKVYGVDEHAEKARMTKKTTQQTSHGNIVPAASSEKNTPLPDNPVLPEMTKGDWLTLHQLIPKQHFTQPPPRYTEASLIGELKKRGLGRPSTYASIIDTLKQRKYVALEKKHLLPTPLGFQVCELLEKHMPMTVDVDFTARMEADLDNIVSGKTSRLSMMQSFYQPFKKTVDKALQEARANRQPAVRQTKQSGNTPKSYRRASPAKGNRRTTPPVGGDCTGPSKSRNAKSLPPADRVGQACPSCQTGQLVMRSSKYGPFLGCSNFNEGCRYTEKVKG